MAAILSTRRWVNSQRSAESVWSLGMAWINNHIHIKLRDIITYPYFNFSGGKAKPPCKLKSGCMIISKRKVLDAIIHPCPNLIWEGPFQWGVRRQSANDVFILTSHHKHDKISRHVILGSNKLPEAGRLDNYIVPLNLRLVSGTSAAVLFICLSNLDQLKTLNLNPIWHVTWGLSQYKDVLPAGDPHVKDEMV